MEKYIELINEKLDEYISINYPQKIFKSMKYTVLLPGKRLRPIMCLETCRLISGSYEEAVPAACAIEMLHAQTLIHDDLPCMDNDNYRRGKLTNHMVFGEAIAVLAGDALLTFAPEIIVKHSHISSDKLVRVLSEYFHAAGANGVIAGQVADIESEKLNVEYNEDDEQLSQILNFIQIHKTADLFKLAIRTGAIIGGASDEIIESLSEFAQNLGIAFQIADDILDETATFEEIGKTAGKDKNAGKLTYTSLYGLEKAKKDLNILLDKCLQILENNKFNSEIFNQIIEKIRIK